MANLYPTLNSARIYGFNQVGIFVHADQIKIENFKPVFLQKKRERKHRD